MPSSLQILAIALLATGVLANPTTSVHLPGGLGARAADGGQSLNPLGGATHALEYVLTNGQRLARGLPPNRPHARRQDRRPRPSQAAAPPSSTSGACSSLNGIVHVTSASPTVGGRPDLNGYLSLLGNEFGEYGYTPDRTQALRVTVNPCNGSPFDILASNGFREFPFLGAIKGFSSDSPNLSPRSFNYAYIGGVTQTVPHATPQGVRNAFSAATDISEDSESAIWSFRQGSDRILEAHWVNTDGGSPNNLLVYVPTENVFVLTGDVPRFEETFEPVANSTFTLEVL